MIDPTKIFDEYAAGYHHLDVDRVIDLFSEDAVFKEPRIPLSREKTPSGSFSDPSMGNWRRARTRLRGFTHALKEAGWRWSGP